MVSVRAIMFVATLLVVAHTSAQSQSPSATVNVDPLGPQVGTRVPDFTLPDQFGRHQSLSTLRGPKGLVLVFNRSADW